MSRILIDQEGLRGAANELRSIDSELDALRGRMRGAALGAMPPHVIAHIGATTVRTEVVLHGNGERLQLEARMLEWRAVAVEIGSAALALGRSPLADHIRTGLAIREFGGALALILGAGQFWHSWHRDVTPWGVRGWSAHPVGSAGRYMKNAVIDRYGDGRAGRLVTDAMRRSSHPWVTNVVHWATSPAGRKVLRRVNGGVAGVSFAMDAYTLYEHGDPREAFARDPDGYASDVASTAFSASTAALFLCPNPVTAGATVVTGAAWVGLEAWEHREEIGDFTEDVADTLDRGADVVVEEAREALDAGADFVRKATFW